MTQICEACGHSNEVGSRFCSSCGRPLNLAEEASTEVLENLATDSGNINFESRNSHQGDQGDLRRAA